MRPPARAGLPPAADRQPAGDDRDGPRPQPLDAGALLRQEAGTLGNQAVMRMLAVMRHEGKEGIKTPHVASDHAAAEDQREHDRTAQVDFDKLDSKGCFDRLMNLAKAKAKSESKSESEPEPESEKIVAIPLEALPPALQALIRNIQGTITDLEAELAEEALEDEEEQMAAEDRLRDHIRGGARSWHDDSPGMLPPVDPKKTSSVRGDFFVRWRAEDAAGGRTTTNKQEKNLAKIGAQSSLLPHREYTATGWSEADQNGRLIYDPIEDQLYLSLFHYKDKVYFRIVAPRPEVGAAAPVATRVTRWDIQFLIYQAWEKLAEELAELDLEGAEEEEEEEEGEEKEPRLTEENAPEAFACVRALMAVRKEHADKYNVAKDTFRRQHAAWEQRVANAEKIRARGKKPENEPGEEPLARDVNVEMLWCGQKFCVNADNGYIGYLKPKPKSQRGRGEDEEVELPSYSQSAMLRSVAMKFRDCVMADSLIHPIDDVAQALAALVAEPSRHPPALMEAVFSLLEVSPLEERKAFGKGNTAFPMAAGGTDATGGVPTRVLLQESALGIEVILKVLTTHLHIERKQAAALVTEVAETRGAAEAVAWVQGVLRAALMGSEAQHTEVERLRKRARPPAPAAPSVVSLLSQPVSPAAPASGLPGAAAQTATAVVEEDESEEEPWGASGPLTPGTVLEMLPTAVAEEFWDGYDDFRFAHPGMDFALTAYEALAYLDRSLDPFAARPLTLAEQRRVEEFKARHPEFLYQEWG